MNLFRLLAGTPRPVARTVTRDVITVALGDAGTIDVLRVRDPRARRIKLSVDERGARLTLPLRASEVAGQRFVLAHGHWLLAQIAELGAGVAPLQPHVDGAVALRGAMLPLRWQTGRYLRLLLDDGALTITAPETPDDAAIRRALRDFYEAQARGDLGRWMPQYLADLPRAPSRVSLRMMSSQWGSLAPGGAMSLDLALVLAPPAAFEYVLVHELCHLIHANHSRRFWDEVEARCPHWRLQRAFFRSDGRRLKATLRHLCGKATG